MIGTILEYVKEYGDYTFKEKPMNEVDSLVFCQFAYLKFDGLVPLVTTRQKSVSMQYIREHADYEKLYADERYEKLNRGLFQAMLKSRRFRSTNMNCYINIVEPEWETQFSAITFLLEDGTIYLAFRGTDETIVGWKEDFNMAFLDPVPGQSFSVKYMHMVTKRFRKKFYTGGHSKGGNFAEYAALNCSKEVQERILNIYNLDGPGFRPEVLQRFDREAIASRIIKIMPRSSIVGMLFQPPDAKYEVVESKRMGLLQHDPYSWLVEEDHFVKVKDIYPSRKFSDGTLNEWILSRDEAELRLFVDTLYQVISASCAVTLMDFTADWKKSMNCVLTALKEVNPETKKVISSIIKSLFTMTKERMKRELGEKASGQKSLE